MNKDTLYKVLSSNFEDDDIPLLIKLKYIKKAGYSDLGTIYLVLKEFTISGYTHEVNNRFMVSL